ncbi:MAG: 4Fe-4S binding protein [Candidatus Firestonebacteria bacterium]
MKKVEINKEKCKSCSYCLEFCPKKLISLSSNINSKGFFYAEFAGDREKCTGCSLCAIMCPDVAIEIHK